MMNNGPASALLGGLLLVFSFPGTVPGAEPRPNILFIMADDHTTQAISAYGGHLAKHAATRNIDRIASEGVRLSHCFCNNSICTPSRASILTGQYSHRNGVYLLNQPLPTGAVTFPGLLQKSGYRTSLYGKWHLKSRPTGFDHYQVLVKQGRYKNPQFLAPGSEALTTLEGWSTDVITDLSIEAMRKRDRDRPFLVMCQYKATHDPWASREPHRSLWRDQDLPEPETLADVYDEGRAAALRTTLKLEQINQETYPHDRLDGVDALTQRRHIYQQYIKDFLRCGRVLDENVGRLLDFLDEENLSGNTVVIYTADQGHFLGEHGFFSKRFSYEEALRVPFLIRWPGKLTPGLINSDMVSNVDIAPTVLELAGVEVPTAVQGRSFLPNLRGHTPGDWPDAVYFRYWQHLLHRNVTAHYGIRTRDSKLIFFHGLPLGMTRYEPTPPQWEFYDLSADPRELSNRYEDPAYGKRVSALKGRLERLMKEVGDREAPGLVKRKPLIP
ncbi:MAG: sulfatase [Verrucomicrobiota bacterium]